MDVRARRLPTLSSSLAWFCSRGHWLTRSFALLLHRSFDEWTDPGVDALSGGRGTFCILPMAQLLMNAAASSVNYAADSVSTALKRPGNFSPVAYLPHQVLHRRRHQTWCRELEQSGVIADVKLVPCRTHCTLECLCNNRD
ncbi:uncharacterized protein LOC100834430 isoform X1 [Brachypodium distachyon]|uniref:uncharacterized protein LOC100834430 isoform X1 n=1 Tax=Brachypodium distachyon TaxID=15368 RepID=UPI00053008CD|nr:uncharacterized protein LOC100834430 isoform X1 [Brachypodium distachyon]|eukprot:XP_010228185.1 uncharacterized protein LOC100834430 isoform X1 [Brachypodium distachyon]